MVSNITIGITTFGRPEVVTQTVSNLRGLSVLINVNDGDSVLAAELRNAGFRVVLAEKPQGGLQGLAALVRHCVTDWLLVTSDEDAVIFDELDELEAFASERKAGVVSAPVWSNGLVKPWPASWADRLDNPEPLHPSHFHDIAGYMSGVLLHRETALKHLPLIEQLGPENNYVLIYPLASLIALMGMDRTAHVYPRTVTVMGEQLPGVDEIPGQAYADPQSRRTQKSHHQEFLSIITGMNPDYGTQLAEARVYEKRAWA